MKKEKSLLQSIARGFFLKHTFAKFQSESLRMFFVFLRRQTTEVYWDTIKE